MYSSLLVKFNIIIVVSCLLLLACEAKQAPEETELNDIIPSVDEKVLDTFDLSNRLWQSGQEELFVALEEMDRLNTAIDGLLNQPTEASLTIAREQWLNAYLAFAKARPLLSIEPSATFKQRLSQIIHWPFYPGFIDSFGPYREGGIVNAIDTPLNSAKVRDFHQQFEANELLLGFYPLGYLLWGEYEGRSAKDFVAQIESSPHLNEASVKLTQLPQNRRRQLLRLQSEWLLFDIKSFYDERSGDMKLAFRNRLPDERLRAITDSIILSLEGMLILDSEPVVLPPRFKEFYVTYQSEIIAGVEQFYLQEGLANYWLDDQEQSSVQQLFAQLKQNNKDSETIDWSMSLEQLIRYLSPDTLTDQPTQ